MEYRSEMIESDSEPEQNALSRWKLCVKLEAPLLRNPVQIRALFLWLRVSKVSPSLPPLHRPLLDHARALGDAWLLYRVFSIWKSLPSSSSPSPSSLVVHAERQVEEAYQIIIKRKTLRRFRRFTLNCRRRAKLYQACEKFFLERTLQNALVKLFKHATNKTSHRSSTIQQLQPEQENDTLKANSSENVKSSQWWRMGRDRFPRAFWRHRALRSSFNSLLVHGRAKQQLRQAVTHAQEYLRDWKLSRTLDKLAWNVQFSKTVKRVQRRMRALLDTVEVGRQRKAFLHWKQYWRHRQVKRAREMLVCKWVLSRTFSRWAKLTAQLRKDFAEIRALQSLSHFFSLWSNLTRDRILLRKHFQAWRRDCEIHTRWAMAVRKRVFQGWKHVHDLNKHIYRPILHKVFRGGKLLHLVNIVVTWRSQQALLKRTFREWKREWKIQNTFSKGLLKRTFHAWRRECEIHRRSTIAIEKRSFRVWHAWTEISVYLKRLCTLMERCGESRTKAIAFRRLCQFAVDSRHIEERGQVLERKVSIRTKLCVVKAWKKALHTNRTGAKLQAETERKLAHKALHQWREAFAYRERVRGALTAIYSSLWRYWVRVHKVHAFCALIHFRSMSRASQLAARLNAKKAFRRLKQFATHCQTLKQSQKKLQHLSSRRAIAQLKVRAHANRQLRESFASVRSRIANLRKKSALEKLVTHARQQKAERCAVLHHNNALLRRCFADGFLVIHQTKVKCAQARLHIIWLLKRRALKCLRFQSALEQMKRRVQLNALRGAKKRAWRALVDRTQGRVKKKERNAQAMLEVYKARRALTKWRSHTKQVRKRNAASDACFLRLCSIRFFKRLKHNHETSRVHLRTKEVQAHVHWRLQCKRFVIRHLRVNAEKQREATRRQQTLRRISTRWLGRFCLTAWKTALALRQFEVGRKRRKLGILWKYWQEEARPSLRTERTGLQAARRRLLCLGLDQLVNQRLRKQRARQYNEKATSFRRERVVRKVWFAWRQAVILEKVQAWRWQLGTLRSCFNAWKDHTRDCWHLRESLVAFLVAKSMHPATGKSWPWERISPYKSDEQLLCTRLALLSYGKRLFRVFRYRVNESQRLQAVENQLAKLLKSRALKALRIWKSRRQHVRARTSEVHCIRRRYFLNVWKYAVLVKRLARLITKGFFQHWIHVTLSRRREALLASFTAWRFCTSRTHVVRTCVLVSHFVLKRRIRYVAGLFDAWKEYARQESKSRDLKMSELVARKNYKRVTVAFSVLCRQVKRRNLIERILKRRGFGQLCAHVLEQKMLQTVFTAWNDYVVQVEARRVALVHAKDRLLAAERLFFRQLRRLVHRCFLLWKGQLEELRSLRFFHKRLQFRRWCAAVGDKVYFRRKECEAAETRRFFQRWRRSVQVRVDARQLILRDYVCEREFRAKRRVLLAWRSYCIGSSRAGLLLRDVARKFMTGLIYRRWVEYVRWRSRKRILVEKALEYRTAILKRRVFFRLQSNWVAAFQQLHSPACL